MTAQQLLYKTVGMGLNVWSIVRPKATARQVLRLFASPPKPQIREKDRSFLKTARLDFLNVGETSIRTYHWGNTNHPLVLLSYGWGYNAGRWRHFVPALVDAGFQVVAYDPPGHGQSPKGLVTLPVNINCIKNLVLKYGKPEVMIGHSFGGASSVQAVYESPERLHPQRMIIMSAFSDAPSVFRQFRSTLNLRRGLYRHMIHYLEQKIRRSIQEYDLARNAGSLPHIEALLVHDPDDAVTPYRHTQRYHAYWANSWLHSPKGAGHHLGKAAVTKAILDFAISGKAPVQAERQSRPMPASHDLARYFAGLEFYL
ncbi:MAG TPA: alpha/beta fold hydrolase [Saprospiraceae bacterium]|nr:alpha/beta fold hydrolase [Saprospiraceae bacterium]HMQ81316.1 alpha/beta fold hydrolase [Saprospiraceae bacterium]